MYDWSGILHRNGVGIARQLGVTFGVPTVGIAKKLLCGEISRRVSNGVWEVVYKGRVIGHAIASTKDSKPFFVSIGHLISKQQSVDIACMFLKHRCPEPSRLAHI